MAVSPSSVTQNGVTATITLSGSTVTVKVSGTSLFWRVRGRNPDTTHYITERKDSSATFTATDGKEYAFQVCSSSGSWSSGAFFTVTFDYKLTISQGTGTKITVKRNGTTLSNGATLYKGDSLSITISANTGYDLSSRSHDDGTYTVSGNVNVSATATKKTYKLSISQGAGTKITVKRGSTTLSNGSSITHGDSLSITITAETGYKLETRSHEDGDIDVSGNVSVSATASKLTYKLSISQGTGTKVSVKRDGTALSNGATITYGDSLVIAISANTGYDLATRSHDDGAYAVSGNINVSATATVKSFKLTISVDAGSTITVNRTSSPKASATTGNLANGATIYYSDVLKISASADVSYEIETLTVNGDAFVSGNSHTVVGAVLIITSTGRLGLAYINDEPYIIVIDEGTEWVQCIPQVDEETEWVICS